MRFAKQGHPGYLVHEFTQWVYVALTSGKVYHVYMAILHSKKALHDNGKIYICILINST